MKDEKRVRYEKAVVRRALKILETQGNYGTTEFRETAVAKTYTRLKIGAREQEVFLVLFLTNQNKLLAAEEMFQGTIDRASVYPREVIKRALELNAAAIILAHNHPSGKVQPSEADKNITRCIQSACDVMNISLLDHLVVSTYDSYSFAENGIL